MPTVDPGAELEVAGVGVVRPVRHVKCAGAWECRRGYEQCRAIGEGQRQGGTEVVVHVRLSTIRTESRWC